MKRGQGQYGTESLFWKMLVSGEALTGFGMEKMNRRQENVRCAMMSP